MLIVSFQIWTSSKGIICRLLQQVLFVNIGKINIEVFNGEAAHITDEYFACNSEF